MFGLINGSPDGGWGVLVFRPYFVTFVGDVLRTKVSAGQKPVNCYLLKTVCTSKYCTDKGGEITVYPEEILITDKYLVQ